ncbi:hypothetical protein TVAG_147000 [Trichomonas vaginalis G3]|uniref:Uncharacterized protein n=1 Tax=Trichomonas vaginalis (strain ATCC PRA-98 / G3) TaxID=412133 RepID=A2DL03_TRIV3|nr:pectin lyase-like family [Trichomonas vaginalis G3]EAY18956.1 hypothetical protein TVAG_147000 [Trichomonas vaginalis G3]KAI5532022.1 pectin lyase-like family [Trichomonas vaginalis G3]|eukprot:XP_001579942.1 hypothetical protein [Trichomonas vaginalis G3]
MMNISLKHLTLQNLYGHSDFISTSAYKNAVFSRCNVRNSFRGFLLDSKLSKTEFSSSIFKNFLTTVVKTQEQDYYNQTINKYLVNIENPLNFTKCTFYGIKSLTYGSCINTCKPLYLDSCLFYDLQALNGGVIYSMSNVDIKHSTFNSCSAFETAGVLKQVGDNTTSLLITSSSFDKNEAKTFGCLYRWSHKWCNIQMSNYTNIKASDCVGVMEIASTDFDMYYCTFRKCQALVNNGCVLVRGPHHCEIWRNIFVSVKHNSESYVTAAAVYIADAVVTSRVAYSIFQDTSSTYVVSAGNNGKLNVLGCIFSSSRSVIWVFKRVMITDCKFNTRVLYPTFIPDVLLNAMQTPSDTNMNISFLNISYNNLGIAFLLSVAGTIALSIIQHKAVQYINHHKKSL